MDFLGRRPDPKFDTFYIQVFVRDDAVSFVSVQYKGMTHPIHPSEDVEEVVGKMLSNSVNIAAVVFYVEGKSEPIAECRISKLRHGVYGSPRFIKWDSYDLALRSVIEEIVSKLGIH